MQLGASYTVAELMDLIIVPSSAAATYMLADMVDPDPDKFVERMNQKAQELGMNNTKYFNCVGVTNNLLQPYQPLKQPLNGDNLTTPEDYALLCTYLVNTYPDILNHTKYSEITVKAGTPYEEHFTSYQISLEGAKYALEGTDGLKTGSSDTAGFNYSSTAKRGDTRLVEIVMGVSEWSDQSGEEIRHLVGNAIMEQAFEQFEYKKVLSKGVHTIDGKQVEVSEDLWDCVPKGKRCRLSFKRIKLWQIWRESICRDLSACSCLQTSSGIRKKGTKRSSAVFEDIVCSGCSFCDAGRSKNRLCGVSQKTEKKTPGSPEKKACKKKKRIRGKVIQGGNSNGGDKLSAMVNQFQPGNLYCIE